MLVYGTHGWIHLSIGRADRWFRWGIVEWTVTILLFLVALPWGPQGIAVAWCVSFWTLTLPAMWYAGKPIGLGVGPIIAAVWRYVLASLFAGLVCNAVFSRFLTLALASGAIGAAERVLFISISFVCLYFGAIVILYRGFSPIKMMTGLLREMAPAAAD
jgi:PST family polysaccharide transporter